MIGTIATHTNGHPWPGGARVSFERRDVRALGVLRSYNDFVKRYLVRLADGREVFVQMSAQAEADQKWLRGIGHKLNQELRQKAIAGTLVVPSRDLSSVVHWKDVAP